MPFPILMHHIVIEARVDMPVLPVSFEATLVVQYNNGETEELATFFPEDISLDPSFFRGLTRKEAIDAIHEIKVHRYSLPSSKQKGGASVKL